MRLRLTVAYDGSTFSGWQSQVGGNTGQDALERAFVVLCNKRVVVHGAGRTDAGVHASGQCAHADVPDGRFTPNGWLRALNANLPEEIRVMKCKVADKDFHAQYSARRKIYRYTIWNSHVLPPLEKNRAWHVPWTLDFAVLKTACQQFVGRHDFAAFTTKKLRPGCSTIRMIEAVRVSRRGPKITLTFEGEGFLYKMVRILTATSIRCAVGKMNLEELAALLHNASPGSPHVAPACGLCLVRVLY